MTFAVYIPQALSTFSNIVSMTSRAVNQQVGHGTLGTLEFYLYTPANTAAVTQPGRLEKCVLSTEQTFPTRPG